MARINVENKLFERGEWMQLLVATGSPDTAIGALVRAWMVAQRYWFPDCQPIPKDVWDREKLHPAVIESGLAEERDGGVYVRGSKEQFAWLFEASEKGKKGGKASAEKRKSAPKKSKPKSTTGESQVDLGQSQVNLGEASLLSSLTPYSSLSSPAHNSDLTSQVVYAEAQAPAAFTAAEPSPIAKVWRAYKAAYSHRYGVEPVWNGTVAGQLKNFVKRLPDSEAPLIAAFFVTHSNARYVNAGHSVGSMLMDAEKLRTEWLTGNRITSQDARNIESADSINNQIRRLGGGK